MTDKLALKMQLKETIENLDMSEILNSKPGRLSQYIALAGAWAVLTSPW